MGAIVLATSSNMAVVADANIWTQTRIEISGFEALNQIMAASLLIAFANLVRLAVPQPPFLESAAFLAAGRRQPARDRTLCVTLHWA